MLRDQLRRGVTHVGLALREPEEFVRRWHAEDAAYGRFVWIALGATAMLGTLTYGMTMGLRRGPDEIVLQGLKLTAAAGLAWAIPLPALYILNSLCGSRMRASTTLLATLVTTSFGGLAMIASIPINWLFMVAIPALPHFPLPATFCLWLVNAVVFTGVGIAMVDVFGRVVAAVEPARGREPVWFLACVAVIGFEFFYAFGLFQFAS